MELLGNNCSYGYLLNKLLVVSFKNCEMKSSNSGLTSAVTALQFSLRNLLRVSLNSWFPLNKLSKWTLACPMLNSAKMSLIRKNSCPSLVKRSAFNEATASTSAVRETLFYRIVWKCVSKVIPYKSFQLIFHYQPSAPLKTSLWHNNLRPCATQGTINAI